MNALHVIEIFMIFFFVNVYILEYTRAGFPVELNSCTRFYSQFALLLVNFRETRKINRENVQVNHHDYTQHQ